MTFSESELDHVIHLAHFTVEPEQKTAYLQQLQNVLTYMSALDQLDLREESASHHDAAASTFLRDDVVCDSTDLLLERNAPKWDGEAFEVPRILGGDP